MIDVVKVVLCISYNTELNTEKEVQEAALEFLKEKGILINDPNGDLKMVPLKITKR